MWLLESGSKNVKHSLEIKSTIAGKSKIVKLLTWIVKGLATGRISQGVIRTLYFLETCFVSALVRVMLAGQLAVSSFDFVSGSVAINAQSLIGIVHKKWPA
jgi:hypothetical protein